MGRITAVLARARRIACAALLVALLGAGLSNPARAAELLMFEEEGCVWCIRWHAEVGPGYPHSSEGQQAPLRRIDIRKQSSVSGALRSPVVATPTFVLIDGGKEVGRITGYPGADFFWGLLGEMLASRRPAATTPRESVRNILFAE